MPNRILKESICESEGLSECSLFAIDLYKRLITYADDYGRFNSDTMIMRARLYPREYEVVTEEDIINGLIELSGVHKIEFYEPDVFNQFGKKGVFGVFPNWNEHQRQRETKTKCPDPDDTSVNDWYLRRFIPLAMKAEILERDGFKCQICGKFLTSCRDSLRFAKHGCGLYHIDHIVPVLQGGRATLENLRLSCPECNLKRKKKFSFKEILDFSNENRVRGNSPQLAADRGNFAQDAASRARVRNPIQSNPNTESESNTNNPPQSPPRGEEEKKKPRFVKPTVEEIKAYCLERNNSVDAEAFYAFYESKGWYVGRNPMKNWKAAVITWERSNKNRAPAAEGTSNPFLDMLRDMEKQESKEGPIYAEFTEASV